MEYSQNQKGLTLIEVLAALVLLSLLTISLFTMATTSFVWVFKAGKSTMAASMANTIMEDIKANSHTISTGKFYGNKLNEDVDNEGLGLAINYKAESKWADFEPEVVVEELKESPSENLLKVTVKVTWQERKSVLNNQVISIISRR